MEATIAHGVPFAGFVSSENVAKRPSFSVSVSKASRTQRKPQVLVSARFPIKTVSNRRRNLGFEVSCSYNNSPGQVAESETRESLDESLLLKKKSEEVEPYLSGRCVYLVGMMGSGKTTVGKILSRSLGYSFCDCDTLIEQEVGGTSVADIFKIHGEGFFRDKETEVLKKLSLIHRHVISTGGGAVIRPINWKYMHTGVSVWLDVPLDALAQRITAFGTGSRPLLANEKGDVYTKTFMRLSSLFESRSEAYANATTRVSLENITAKFGQLDVCDLTPTAIAIEALEQIANFLKKEGHNIK